jgi:outer membrane immunogenic protein
MRKVLGLVGAALVFAGPAFAADLPFKAPAMPLGPVLSWTGWYIGATAGYGWTNQGIDDSLTSTFCNVTLVGCRAVDVPNASTALAAAIPPHFSTNPKGFIGGGEIGFNQQVGQFVWGVEADLSGADIKGSDTRSFAATFAPANTVNVLGSANEKLDFFGTLRGRFGFLLTPPLLVYATGGFAFGHVSATTTLTETVGGACFCGPSPTVAASSSATLPGWTVGGGLEWMFAPQWTLKGEYLYYDLGTLSYALPGIVQLNGAGTPFFGAGVNSTATVKGNIARVGVNFHF